MYELPLNAKVTCTDGHGGTSVAVTLNQESKVISHIIVEDSSGNQHLVPLKMAGKTGDDEIRLDCTVEELREMPLFLVTEFVERAPQQSGDWETEESEWEDGVDISDFEMDMEPFGLPLEVERVPEGEVPLHRSTEIIAKDDYAGKVETLIIDPESGQITHLVVHLGHLWSKKNIMVPLTAVDSFDYESVYLNVDKKAIEEFPTVPK